MHGSRHCPHDAPAPQTPTRSGLRLYLPAEPPCRTFRLGGSGCSLRVAAPVHCREDGLRDARACSIRSRFCLEDLVPFPSHCRAWVSARRRGLNACHSACRRSLGTVPPARRHCRGCAACLPVRGRPDLRRGRHLPCLRFPRPCRHHHDRSVILLQCIQDRGASRRFSRPGAGPRHLRPKWAQGLERLQSKLFCPC